MSSCLLLLPSIYSIHTLNCLFARLKNISKKFHLLSPRLIFTLLIPERVVGLMMNRMWWISRGPSELVLSILNLENYFIIWRWASMVSEFRIYCATIMDWMYIWLVYLFSCGACQYHLDKFLSSSVVRLRPLRRECICLIPRIGMQIKILLLAWLFVMISSWFRYIIMFRLQGKNPYRILQFLFW